MAGNSTSNEAELLEAPVTEDAAPPQISEIIRLMRRMGAKSFSPLPPDQHHWQRCKGLPHVFRLWGWMCDHTVFFGHRCEYAVGGSEHDELHIEHAAQHLGMDPANAWRAWRLGVRMGLWRNGTADEGKRRLYLCGRVDAEKVEKTVSTDSSDPTAPEPVDRLRPYILKKLVELPPERAAEFRLRYNRQYRVALRAQAELTACVRMVIDAADDRLFQEFGIRKIREEHKSKETADEIQARQTRIASIHPDVQKFFQTIDAYVLTQPETPHNGQNGHCTEPATLLREKLPDNNENSLAGGRNLGSSRPVKTPPVDRQSPPKQQPAGKEPNPPKTPQQTEAEPRAETTAEEKAAIDLFFLKTREYQDAYPHTHFGDVLVTPANKGDMALARKILAILGSPAEMEGYLYQVAVNLGLQRPSLGLQPRPRRTPAANPHDRYVNLFKEWAEDYGRAKPNRDRERRESIIRQGEIEARERARQEQQAADAAEAERIEQEWRDMPAPDKDRLLAIARVQLKTEPYYTKMSKEQREEMAATYARKLFAGKGEREAGGVAD